MQSTLRTKLAVAALSVASMGALFAAQPAAAAPAFVHASVQRDHRAPAIYNVTPSQGARVGDRGLTQVAARFGDDRSGIDPRAVTLRVDGRNVTRQARVDNNDIRYADNLRPGRHFAQLQVRDRAGNVATKSWSFVVAGYGRDHRG